MKVKYLGSMPAYQVVGGKYGVELHPGENEVSGRVGRLLVHHGICVEVEASKPKPKPARKRRTKKDEGDEELERITDAPEVVGELDLGRADEE